jgi:pimeloyl-ACP methyl ester carboxylesterase
MTFLSFKKSPEAGADFSDEQALDDRIAATGKPVTVVFGAEDRIVDPESADDYRDIPGGRVIVLQGIGHTPQMEAPARATAIIRARDKTSR